MRQADRADASVVAWLTNGDILFATEPASSLKPIAEPMSKVTPQRDAAKNATNACDSCMPAPANAVAQ